MHKRLRIAHSTRLRMIQTDIDTCDACIRHLIACEKCKTEKSCELGDSLFYGFKVAQARAKLLAADTPYVII